MHGQKISLGCRRPRAFTAGAQGANVAERVNPPFHLPGEGQTHCGHQQMTLGQIKALMLMLKPVLCLVPWVFLLQCCGFLHGCSCTSLQGDGERRLIWTENGSAAILCDQEHLCPARGLCCFWGSAQALRYCFYFSYSISLGCCFIPEMMVSWQSLLWELCSTARQSHLLTVPSSLLITEWPASAYSSPLSRTTTVFGHKTCGEQIHLFICALRTTGMFCTTARIHGSKKLKNIWKKDLDFEAFPSFLNEVALG